MNFKILICFLLLISPLMAIEGPSHIVDPREVVANELSRLDQLISATQQSLKQQQILREMILHYQDVQTRYLDNSNDNEALFRMIKAAHAILEKIKAMHLETAFEPEFLSELAVVSKPFGQLGIPKP